MPVFELGMKFGGGVAVPGAAMPMRLGAGASTAADFACTAGAVPPLTTSGVSAGSSTGTGADLVGAAVDDADGFDAGGVRRTVTSDCCESAASADEFVEGA